MFNLQKKQTKKYLSIGIPILVFLGIAWKLSDEMASNRFDDIQSYLNTNIIDLDYLFLVVACSFLNWSLEALKWKSLISPIEKVSFFKSLGSVFAGLSIGFFTPRSVGDYLGRAMLLDSSRRFEVFGGLLVSRVSQMLATVLIGFGGVFYLREKIELSTEFNFVLYLSGMILFLIGVLFLLRKVLIQKFLNLKHLRNLANLFVIIKNYQSELYLRVLLISFARYLSFLLQFVLVALILDVSFSLIPFLAVVAVMLLLKSVVVSFNFFSDLGMRELGALMLFPLIGISAIEGVSISLVVWVFNVLAPSVLGSFIVWKAKW
jgi:uncharacterized membrane protein YbhN (UPF0104 family)